MGEQQKQQPDEPLSRFAQHRMKHSGGRPGSQDLDDRDVFAFTESSCLVHLVLWIKLSLRRPNRGSYSPHAEVGAVPGLSVFLLLLVLTINPGMYVLQTWSSCSSDCSDDLEEPFLDDSRRKGSAADLYFDEEEKD